MQVGDVLDRGGDEVAILSLLRWLNIQAQLKGGAVFQVPSLILQRLLSILKFKHYMYNIGSCFGSVQ